MPSNHGAVPLFERPVLLGSQSVFIPPLFQSYFDASFLASWFGAKAWSTFRSLWRKFVPGRVTRWHFPKLFTDSCDRVHISLIDERVIGKCSAGKFSAVVIICVALVWGVLTIG